MESQEAIEAHNRKTLWEEATTALQSALDSLQHAQGIMDDLNVPHIGGNLTPHVEAVERFRDLARSKTDE